MDQQSVTRRWSRQLTGLAIGIGVGLMSFALIPAINLNFSLPAVVIWSGAVGSAIYSWKQFELSGASLTRSENRIINLLVGLGIPLFFLVVITILIT